MSEIHGMSQRGGSVSSQIRYGNDVHSPVIEIGGADLLIAFEKLEALRYLEYLKQDGAVIVNNEQINPMSVLSGAAKYPSDVIEIITQKAPTFIINASQMAENLGNIKVMNVILLGAVAKQMALGNIHWNKIIEQNVKPQFIELNQKAFAMGYES
jgi:indolepyruvate ferredoxin oxidoreductase beta subunit